MNVKTMRETLNPTDPKTAEIASLKLFPLLTLTLAIVAVSCAAIFIRFAEQELGANATVLNRLAIATVAFWALTAIQDWRQPWPPTLPLTWKQGWQKPSADRLNDGIKLIAVAAVSSASVVLWAQSLTETSIANSTLLRNLTPIFTSLGGWLLLGQQFDRRFILGTVIAVLGAIAIGVEDFQISHEHLLGDGLALLSAVLYGTNLLLVEGLRSRLSTSTILLWRCGIGTVLLFPIASLLEEQLFPQTWQVWLAVAALALVCQVLGQGLLVYSLKQFSSGFIAVVLLLEPILAAILAWAIFAEALDWTNWLAFVMVLSGIYLARSSGSATQAVVSPTVSEGQTVDNPSH
jgi:drug/metabolite transporter (DMT)-like permease